MEATPENIVDELPGMTRARAVELLAELSLIDIGRLLLAKAAGPDGLSKDNAACLEMETKDCKFVLRRLRSKMRKKP